MNKLYDLTERTVFLEINVIKLCGKLSEDLGNSNFPDQLVHYASAIGGNYREAQRARSRVEQNRILNGIITDINDLTYFLELLMEIEEGDEVMLNNLIGEARQILLLMQKAVKAKGRIKLKHKAYAR